VRVGLPPSESPLCPRSLIPAGLGFAGPSDFMYGHFRAFAQFDQQRRQLWESVLSATQAVANQVQR